MSHEQDRVNLTMTEYQEFYRAGILSFPQYICYKIPKLIGVLGPFSQEEARWLRLMSCKWQQVSFDLSDFFIHFVLSKSERMNHNLFNLYQDCGWIYSEDTRTINTWLFLYIFLGWLYNGGSTYQTEYLVFLHYRNAYLLYYMKSPHSILTKIFTKKCQVFMVRISLL